MEKDRHQEWRKKMMVIFWANLVLGFLELIPLKSGDDKSENQVAVTVTKYNENQAKKEPKTKWKSDFWWKKENWTRVNKAPEI